MSKDNKKKALKKVKQRPSNFGKKILDFFNYFSNLVHELIEALLSNFRFSISFRISLIYFRLFLSSLFLVVALTIVGMAAMLIYSTYYDNQRIITALEGQIEEKAINEQMLLGYDYEIAIYQGGQIIFSSVTHEKVLDHSHFYIEPMTKSYYYINDIDILIEDQVYRISIIKNLNGIIEFARNLLKLMILVDIIRILVIIRKGRKINKKVLSPIQDMNDAAKRISAHNLNQRINVAGTKNELKDLAVTINEMIERIEGSYNQQKQFVSDASHELRTPIAVIQGYANLLDRWGKEDKDILNESIYAIKNEAINMQNLVEKLLFLARHDRKTLRLDKEEFEIRPLLEEMIKETRMIASDHSINKGIIEDGVVCGDKQSIKQAIRIFIDNAIKYTPKGGEITIKCEKEKNGCLISVIDNGIGISKKEMQRIFDRFYRVDEARANIKNGHGLGLAIAKLIILAHNGKIRVRSKEGEGSIFSVYLKTEEKNKLV